MNESELKDLYSQLSTVEKVRLLAFARNLVKSAGSGQNLELSSDCLGLDHP